MKTKVEFYVAHMETAELPVGYMGSYSRTFFPITLNRRSYIVSHDLLALAAPSIQCIFKLELPAAGYFGVTPRQLSCLTIKEIF